MTFLFVSCMNLENVHTDLMFCFLSLQWKIQWTFMSLTSFNSILLLLVNQHFHISQEGSFSVISGGFYLSNFQFFQSEKVHKVKMCIKTGGWKLPRSRLEGFWAQLHILWRCMEKKSRLERSKLRQLYCWMEITWYQTKLSTRYTPFPSVNSIQ